MKLLLYVACLIATAGGFHFSCKIVNRVDCLNFDAVTNKQNQDGARISTIDEASADAVNLILFMSTKTEYLPLNLFRFFKNLTKLYMIHTYTKMLPPKNGHFLMADKLEEIVFVNQRFQELGGRVFEGCSNVKAIHLDNDEINALDEDTFDKLATLENLTMSNNEITALPLKMFSSLKSLKFLDLSSNMLSTLSKSALSLNRFLSRVKLDRNRFLYLPAAIMPEDTFLDFTDSLCIDKVFEITSDLNNFTSTKCNVENITLVELVNSYREQSEINLICGDKNMVENLQKELDSFEQKKLELELKKENLENEIIKTKMYKDAMC